MVFWVLKDAVNWRTTSIFYGFRSSSQAGIDVEGLMEFIPDFSIIIFELRGEQLALVWVFFWGECGGVFGRGEQERVCVSTITIFLCLKNWLLKWRSRYRSVRWQWNYVSEKKKLVEVSVGGIRIWDWSSLILVWLLLNIHWWYVVMCPEIWCSCNVLISSSHCDKAYVWSFMTTFVDK